MGSALQSVGSRALLAAGAVGLGAAVWGIGIERHLYTLRQVAAPVLPPGSPSVRVLHLSDVHMAPWQRRRQQWIASLADLRPDLIVNTGDNLGHAEGLRGIRAAFSPFRGIPGVFVHGSNDEHAPAPRNPLRYFLGPSRIRREPEKLDATAMDRFFTATLGWHRVDNASASITVRGVRFDVLGTGDAHHGQERLDLLPSLADDLRARDGDRDGDGFAESDATAVTLGVTHAPYQRVLNALMAAGSDMLFAGHTHGGQVCLPGYGTIVANCDIPLDQAKGLSAWTSRGRSVPLHVSAGLGHSIYAPVRFACRPEATMITLVARPSV